MNTVTITIPIVLIIMAALVFVVAVGNFAVMKAFAQTTTPPPPPPQSCGSISGTVPPGSLATGQAASACGQAH
jgi:cytoskeletal protein RodZ